MLKKERMPSNCHSRTSVKSSKYLFDNVSMPKDVMKELYESVSEKKHNGR